MSKEEQWLESAKKNGFKVLAIVLDLEEKDQFPMFFESWMIIFLFKRKLFLNGKLRFLKFTIFFKDISIISKEIYRETSICYPIRKF